MNTKAFGGLASGPRLIFKWALVDAAGGIGASRLHRAIRVKDNFWVAVKELKLNYHNSETALFTIYPYYGNLN